LLIVPRAGRPRRSGGNIRPAVRPQRAAALAAAPAAGRTAGRGSGSLLFYFSRGPACICAGHGVGGVAAPGKNAVQS